MMKKLLHVFILICLMGCSSKPIQKPVQTFRMNISREPPTMDPRKGSEWVGTAMHYMMFEGLVRLTPSGTLLPAQAKSIEISDDRLTYTFHLRGTTWSNGSQVTAKDFEMAWKNVVDPSFGAPSSYLLYPIKNAERIKKGELSVEELGASALDDLTLVVTLEKPTPYFLELVSFSLFFPVHHQIDFKNQNWMQEASPNFVSNGPFTLKKWKHNQEIVFEKNKNYWEAPLIHLDEVHVSMIGDETTVLSMFNKGELDIIGMVVSPIPTEALHHFHRQGMLHTHAAPATTIITFNTEKFPYNNRHIRRALAFAIDRNEIVTNITELGEDVATNLIPACLNHGVSNSYFKDHNLKKANKELALGLKELKLHALPPLKFLYSSTEVTNKLAQVLQEQWKNSLGIEVEIQKCEHKLLLDRLVSRDYEMATCFWFAQYIDPMSILDRFKHKTNLRNYPSWENKEYTQLMDKSALETPEERQATFAKAEAILLDEMPLTPLYHWKNSFMLSDKFAIKNLEPHGSFDYARIEVIEP